MHANSAAQIYSGDLRDADLAPLRLAACSACAGDYEDPERTAGPDEEEFAEREYQGEDTVDPSGSGID